MIVEPLQMKWAESSAPGCHWGRRGTQPIVSLRANNRERERRETEREREEREREGETEREYNGGAFGLALCQWNRGEKSEERREKGGGSDSRLPLSFTTMPHTHPHALPQRNGRSSSSLLSRASVHACVHRRSHVATVVFPRFLRTEPFPCSEKARIASDSPSQIPRKMKGIHFRSSSKHFEPCLTA